MNVLRGVARKNQENWNRGWIVLNFFFVLNKRLLFLLSLFCVFLYSESPAHILMYKGSVGDVRRGRGEVIIPKIPNFRKNNYLLTFFGSKGGWVHHFEILKYSTPPHIVYDLSLIVYKKKNRVNHQCSCRGILFLEILSVVHFPLIFSQIFACGAVNIP